MNIDYASIGLRIKHYRVMRNLSQEQLADQVGMSYVYISYIETAKKRPSLEAVINIANALRVSSDELLVDNIAISKVKDSDFEYLLLDCTPEEQAFLLKSLKAIRSILKDYIIK